MLNTCFKNKWKSQVGESQHTTSCVIPFVLNIILVLQNWESCWGLHPPGFGVCQPTGTQPPQTGSQNVLFLLRCSQIICYAVACTETARIAQLVARQRTSKRKTGRQINCQMRVKKTMPFFLEGRTFHIKVCPRAYGNATSVPDNY